MTSIPVCLPQDGTLISRLLDAPGGGCHETALDAIKNGDIAAVCAVIPVGVPRFVGQEPQHAAENPPRTRRGMPRAAGFFRLAWILHGRCGLSSGPIQMHRRSADFEAANLRGAGVPPAVFQLRRAPKIAGETPAPRNSRPLSKQLLDRYLELW